jgi:MYXO-CTERM domain-containing protein
MRAGSRVFAVVVALAPAAARADAAPPEDYVDPCASMTFEASCRRCSAPEFKSRECHEGARAAGLVERCRGWNYAMYCARDGDPRPAPPDVLREALAAPVEVAPAPREAPAPVAAPAATPVAAPTPAPVAAPAGASGGCAVGGGDGAGFALVALLGALVRRRRRAA